MATSRRAPPATPATAATPGGVDNRGNPSPRSATLPTGGAASVAELAGGAGWAAEASARGAGSAWARGPGRELACADEFEWCGEVLLAERLSS